MQGAGSENHGAIWIEVGRVSFCGDILPQGPWPERSENRRGKTARSLYANADRSYSLVGLGEALHRMREKELDKICFKRGQDASQPLVALATLRIAQYDYDERGSERALVRFMVAAEEFSLVGLLLNMVS